MALHITGSGATNIGFADGILIMVNAALTGTITTTTVASTIDGGSASSIGVITNPTVGQPYVYRGLRGQGTVAVNPSGTCDITVQKLSPGMAGI